jgi:hypothetical protein
MKKGFKEVKYKKKREVNNKLKHINISAIIKLATTYLKHDLERLQQ